MATLWNQYEMSYLIDFCLFFLVKNVQKVIPDVKKLLVNITGQSDSVQSLGREVTTNIAALKEKIAIARNQANLVCLYIFTSNVFALNAQLFVMMFIVLIRCFFSLPNE